MRPTLRPSPRKPLRALAAIRRFAIEEWEWKCESSRNSIQEPARLAATEWPRTAQPSARPWERPLEPPSASTVGRLAAETALIAVSTARRTWLWESNRRVLREADRRPPSAAAP